MNWGRRCAGLRHRARTVVVCALLALGGMAVSCGVPDDGQVESVHGAPTGDPKSGKQLVDRYGCVACHRIPGSAFPGVDVGPPLDQWTRRRFIAGMTENTRDMLIRWIQMPQSVSPGTAMPNLGVSDQDARDIAAYLLTLR